jgi:hypothetical protein
VSYSDFTIEQLKEEFDIETVEDINIFPQPVIAEVPELLRQVLQRYIPLAITMSTEKARSELIIAPILAEFKLLFKEYVSLFSGIDFNIDAKRGLNGRCDYILSKTKEQLAVSAPVFMLVEAKNDNITSGIPQCIAEMIAARLFNEQKQTNVSTIYGAVTTGSLWRFLKLEGTIAYVDVTEYPIQQIETILGILSTIAES